MSQTRVLVVSDGGNKLALTGPDLRVSQIVTALSSTCEVTLTGDRSLFSNLNCKEVISLSDRSLGSLILANDIIICRPGLLGISHMNQIMRTGKFLVTDLLIPQPVEGLHYFGSIEPDGQSLYNTSQRRLRRALKFSDFFLCSSKNQQLFWLGALTTLRNYPVSLISEDPFLSSLVGLFPFGIKKHKNLISASEKISTFSQPFNILWGGGIWSWTDPQLLLKSILLLPPELMKKTKVLFPGTTHPDSKVHSQPLLLKIQNLVEESPELSKIVDVNPSWMNPLDYSKALRASHIGISLHRGGLESVLSWRFRIVSYIENLIPVILTENCPLASLIEEKGGGIVIPPGDSSSCSKAISELLVNKERYEDCIRAMERVRDSLFIDNVSESLLNYCNEPYKAPDLVLPSWKNYLNLFFP